MPGFIGPPAYTNFASRRHHSNSHIFETAEPSRLRIRCYDMTESQMFSDIIAFGNYFRYSKNLKYA